jgi:hypothetical protein
MSITIKLFLCLLFTLCLSGVSGCGDSECRKVRELEEPAYLALQESIESRVYWEKRKESDMSVMKVCRDVLKPNAKNWDEENWTEVCDWETGAITGTVMRGLENAEARNRSRFEEWSQIVKLYPDCFDPDKVIEANS